MRLFLCLLFCVFMIYGCKDSSDGQDLEQNLPQKEQKQEKQNKTLQKKDVKIKESPQKEIPQEVKDFSKNYHNYIHNVSKDDKIKATKEAIFMDKTFVALREKYKDNNEAMSILGELSCLLPDCSATKDTKSGTYIYKNTTIQNAYNAILLDKKTLVFIYFDIMKYYSYLLSSMQTTSIDLSQYPKKTPFQTLKFAWDNDSLEVILIPKAEICKPYIYTYKITFLQDSSDVLVKLQEERLSAFSYPSDLVAFVAKSCACARALGYIPNLTKEELSVAKNALSQNEKYCNEIENERAELWDKYMQDTRIIGILQHEQKLYPK